MVGAGAVVATVVETGAVVGGGAVVAAGAVVAVVGAGAGIMVTVGIVVEAGAVVDDEVVDEGTVVEGIVVSTPVTAVRVLDEATGTASPDPPPHAEATQMTTIVITAARMRPVWHLPYAASCVHASTTVSTAGPPATGPSETPAYDHRSWIPRRPCRD